jgi:hypothetical protein
VVQALLSTKLAVLGDACLAEVGPFTAADEQDAADDAERLIARMAPASKDVRVLVAAGVHAFQDDPDRFARPEGADRTQHPSALLISAVLRARVPGTRRGRGEPADAGAAAAAERLERERAEATARVDRATGSSLRALLVGDPATADQARR